MSDIIITPASGKIDFYQDLGASSLAKIELTSTNDLALSTTSGNLIIGDASRDIYIGNGINDVDIIFEQNGEIRPLPAKTLNIGTSGSFTQILASKVNINQNSFTSIPLDVYSSTSGATILNVAGTKGTLFSVTDNLSGSLMSVNNDAGLPVFEVFSDDRVVAGRFGQNDFIMTSGGNVGIGTGVPSSKFHVLGTSTFNGDVSSTGSFIAGSGSAALPSFEFINDVDTGLFSPAANTFGVSTSGAERLRVDSAGRVGIGTTSPTSALQVSGLVTANSGNFTNSLQVNGTGVVSSSGGNSGYLSKFAGSNTINNSLVYDDGTNIGIGTVSPIVKLEVAGDIYGNNVLSAGYLISNFLLSVNDFDGASPGIINIGEFTSLNQLYWSIDQNGSGNFSVLSVNDTNVSLNGHTHTASNITNFNSSVSGLLPVGTANYLSKFGTGGSGLGNSLIFDNGTNIGIGTTSPTSRLHVAGDVLATGSFIAGSGSAGNPSFEFVGDADTGMFTPSGNIISFATSGVERLRIDNIGNVGIGTTSPTAQLHVVGTGNFTNNLNIGGNLTITAGGTSSSNQIFLNGTTSNSIAFNNIGVSEPSNAIKVTGKKIILYPSRSIGVSEDFSLGIAGDGFGGGGVATRFVQTIDSTSSRFQWYADSTNMATLTGSGVLTIAGATSQINVDNLRFDNNMISATNVNGNLIIKPNASGSLQADDAGNSRGIYSVDLQRSRASVSGVAHGSYSVIGGGRNNRSAGNDSAIGGGKANSAGGAYSTVGGGLTNSATGSLSTVGGGNNNTASGGYSTVGGGTSNTADGGNYGRSTVGGGANNSASGYYSTVGGGYGNTASGPHSIIGGGQSNSAGANRSTVGGGQSNSAGGNYSTVGGGQSNSASSPRSTVGGGYYNTASSAYSTIGGGRSNSAGGNYSSTVGGGQNNSAGGTYSTVSGGKDNSAAGDRSTVGGGYGNSASVYRSTVCGGHGNSASGAASVIGGGTSNTASSYYSTVAGGLDNSAGGNYSTVSGGRNNSASGYYSTVVGGKQTKVTRYGETSHSAGKFANDGDAQHTILIARNVTSDATGTILFLDGFSAGLTVPAETTWIFTIKLSAYNDTDNLTAGYNIRGCIRRNAANNTSIIGSNIIESWSEGTMSGCVATATADDTNEALQINVTGLASKNIRWVAVVDISQVSYAAP